jgi:hypothetical protein
VDKKHVNFWCRDYDPHTINDSEVNIRKIEEFDVEKGWLEGGHDRLQNCFDLGNQVAYQIMSLGEIFLVVRMEVELTLIENVGSPVSTFMSDENNVGPTKG